MASHTAWTGGGSRRTHNTSALTSDLLPSRPPSAAKRKGAESSHSTGLPLATKNEEVRRLESLIQAVENNVYHPRDPVEGCFCRAQKHTLSKYVPLCMNCGLVICAIQHPVHPCPSCRTSLLSQASTRSAVAARLHGELEGVLQMEAEVREQERLEKLQRDIEAAGGGAFPVLQPMAHSNHPARNEPRKVLSLNSKTKKATISTFSRSATPPAVSDKARDDDDGADDVVSREERRTRVPPHKVMPEHLERAGTERRWELLKGGGAMYVQPPRAPRDPNTNVGASAKRKKAKGEKKVNLEGSVILGSV